MKRMKQLLALVLALVMIASTFAACGEPKATPDEAEVESTIVATAVQFAKSGKYTTTVSSEKVDLSGITAENTEIRYADPYTDALTTADLEAAGSATADEADAIESLYPLTAKVESIKANDNGGYDIVFTDEGAAEYAPSSYAIYLNDVDGAATAEVEFPEITVTPDIEFVTPADKEIKLTLTLDGSEFEDGIGRADLAVSNAFEKLNAEVISSSANNLTLKLEGFLTKNVAGAYQWGTVSVKPSGIKDGYKDVPAKVDVKLDYIGFDGATLKYTDGIANVELLTYGIDISSLTKDDVTINDVSVEAVELIDDNHVALALKADGVKNANDFADLVNGKVMKIGENETEAVLSQANFYPVFDYVSEKGDNLELTLKLYAYYGTFNEDISADMFSFADGFEGAKVESVTVDSDITATLVISVPANGQTGETLDMDGTVTIAAGALSNSWGDKTTKDYSNTRNYSVESLGREVTLNKDTLLKIQEYTRGKDTLFGTICYWGGVAGQVYSLTKSVLEVTGVVKSEHDQVMEALAELDRKIDVVLENQYKIISMLDELREDSKEAQLDSYKDDLDQLQDYVDLMEGMLQSAALYMALEDAEKEQKISAVPSFAGMNEAQLAEAVRTYSEYIPDVNDMSEKEQADYGDRLVDYIIDRSHNDKDREFSNFEANYDKLCTALLRVANKLSRQDGSNPLTRYDELCTMQFNFDTQCSAFRAGQRETAIKLLGDGLAIIGICEKAINNPRNANFKIYKNNVEAAANRIDALSVDLGLAPEEVKANPRTVNEVIATHTPTYIGELALSGTLSGKSDALNILTDRGFTPINRDLNEGAGGDWIYLGYKTTKDYSKAIKDIKIRIGNANCPSSFKSGGATYYKVQGFGDSSFTGSGLCDLNHNVKGSEWMYLYYTTDEVYGQNAITLLYVSNYYIKNPITNTTFSDNNLNQGGGGSELHFGANFAGKDEVQKDTQQVTYDEDPAYYPYSYVLGKKVAYIDSTTYTDYRNITGAIKETNGSYRNFTDQEVSEFQKRIRYGSLREDFAAAGLYPSQGLVTKLYYKTVSVKPDGRGGGGKYYKVYNVLGNIIELNNKSYSSYQDKSVGNEIAYYLDHYKEGKLVSEFIHHFIYFECYN